MNLIFFDDGLSENLLPLTFTRPACDLRIGIKTIRKKWETKWGLEESSSLVYREYLAKKFPTVFQEENIYLNGRLLPNETLVEQIKNLKPNHGIESQKEILAFRSSEKIQDVSDIQNISFEKIDLDENQIIQFPYDLFRLNGQEIQNDFEEITKDRISEKASSTNTLIHPENIFIEAGAKLECAILNATNGPIYIAKNAEIMENSVIRGPFALCENATVKLSAKIYGPTTIGPHCKVGGEINNSILIGYSNKGHDGFLGNSVIGEWCNLGADTNNSNLKNNYDEVKLWNYPSERFKRTGLTFCGLIMGDHSKCGINTMFNTGTVVGIGANIFGGDFPRNFIPSFSWGGKANIKVYQIKKFFETAAIVMKRRAKELNEMEKEILENIFEATKIYRRF